MLRACKVVLALLLVAASSATAQSAKEGSFTGQTYTNHYFGIAFELPSFLQPATQVTTTVQGADSRDEWMLAIAREGRESYGIIMLAEHLKQGGIVSADDFLARARASRVGDSNIGASGHRTGQNGLVFDWLDWKERDGTYGSAVVTQRGDYLLAARCSAKNAADLNAMKQALFGMTVLAKSATK